ncbi:rRNA pseudouridine synthase [Candidatus Saccharibacteria bacterium]|nr:rRNA pseudouridine synthase [Candidatus Saccharibacteria bacterium]
MNTPLNDTPLERLNKFLALQLGVSRREADEYIAAGRVHVNNKQAQLGARIDTSHDTLSLDGKPLSAKARSKQTILFHKPVGYVCSRKAQGDAPTIFSLLPQNFQHLQAVGRLDKLSSGLLLLSNDGDLAFRLTHPKFSKRKVYRVRLREELAPLHQQMISDYGVQLEDGISKLTLTRLDDNHRYGWQVEMSEGRNRQIRRTFEALGYSVVKLHRIEFGNYHLGELKRGEWREL